MKSYLDDDDFSNRFYQDENLDVESFVRDYDSKLDLDNSFLDDYVSEEGSYDDEWDEDE